MINIINTSNEFKQYIQEEREFICTAKITLSDGTVITVGNENIMSSGFNFDEGTSSDGSFDIGAAIIGKFTLIIDNTEEQFSDYDFTEAKIVPSIGLQLSSTVETINKGVYTVDEAISQGATIRITALDNMTKFEKDFTLDGIFPASLQEILNNCCTECGVTTNSSSIPNGSFIVQAMPEEAMTFREVISYIAQIAGCYAKCDTNGRLVIDWYDTSAFERESNLDGGRFDSSNPYSSGDTADGGNFTDYSSGYSADGGAFTATGNYHHIYKLISQSISTDDVVITGIQVTDSSEDAESYLYGYEGYVLDISDNPFIQAGDAEKAATFIGERIVGMRFRPLSVSTVSDPSIEAGDCAYVSDRKGNAYMCYISNTGFNISGSQTVTCDAETPSRNSAQNGSVLTKAIVAARNETAKKISAYDLAVQQLTNLMAMSFGVYKTNETLADGSVVYYMHNKPTLAESKTIWKMAADAFAVSTDGGKTWNAGMDSSGNAVVNVLSAIGINFDWASGGTLSLGGANNGNGVLKVYDESGVLMGTWSKDGILMALDDGSSIVMNASDGFCRKIGNTANQYYSLYYSTTVTFPAQPPNTSGYTSTYVTLPDEFNGKKVKATISVAETQTNLVPSTFGVISSLATYCSYNAKTNRIACSGYLQVYDIKSWASYSMNNYLTALVTATA